MSKQKVSITNTSIRSGVTSDAKKAICEFIWNGFDANANKVEIQYSATELGLITSFSIIDDGEGVSRNKLGMTFGKYQDSTKKSTFQWSSQVKGHKGKGRYAFNCFATKAEWETVCKEDDKLLRHTITIDADDNDYYNDHSGEQGKNVVVHGVNTGTKVSFENVNLTASFFESQEFIDYLKKEYAVFLKLNEKANKCILINGVKLDYSSVIAETDSKRLIIKDKQNDDYQYDFDLTFIRWSEKMKENYSSYFLDEKQAERYETTTSLNNKDTGFHHSVYVVSSYFNGFVPSVIKSSEAEEDDSSNQQELEFGDLKPIKSAKDKVFKDLLKGVKAWLVEKQKLYISEVAGEELWQRFENNGTVALPANDYEKPRFEDLKQTVKAIYSVQPKVFDNIKKEQAKALVGCLDLLLQTDKREDLLTIVDGVVKMTDEERHRLAELLKVTELSHITNTIAMLESRLKIVSAIKAMLYNRSLKAYEVADVQKMVSSAFWLFGEQYNIVTEAEPDFQKAIEQYLVKIATETKGVVTSCISTQKITHPDVNKEMDFFAFRQTKDSLNIENIVVELKRPTVKLGERELSQIKTYMRLIYKESQFNSTKSKWTFILVGNELDGSGSIEAEYKTNQTWGKKDLVCHIQTDDGTQNYEIYVKTWSTIFDDFEIRHDFLLKKLNMRRESLIASYTTKEDLHNIVASEAKHL